MAEDHVPPNRSENIINGNGTPTIKFAEYLEKVGETSDNSSSTNDISLQFLAGFMSDIGSNRARINDQNKNLKKITQLVSGILVDNGKLRSDMRKQEVSFVKSSQLISQLLADNAKLRARLNQKDKEIKNINQLMASN